MKRLALTFLIVWFLLLSGCGAPATPTTPVSEPLIPTHFATYTDEARFFSISYPPDWMPFPSSLEGIPVSKDFFKVYDSDASLVGLFFVFIAEAPRESGVY